MMVNAIIEVPKGSKYKYKYIDGRFVVKNKFNNNARSPYNYGFIENTIAPDKAPLDMIMITNKPREQGHVKAKVIGAIARYDMDDKIVTVNCKSKINSIRRLQKNKLNMIIKTWTGNHPGMTPLKKILGPKDAEKLIRKFVVI